MDAKLTARHLFDELKERLALRWEAGKAGGDTELSANSLAQARPALVGYLNLIHPNRIQVLGEEELQYLDSLESKIHWETVARITSLKPLAIVVGDGLSMPRDLLESAEEHQVPVFSSTTRSNELVALLQFHAARRLARNTSLHGVFMEVFTIGVLITGDSGTGKSELALELLTRGHRLIADDAPEFTQISPEIIDGRCPEALQDCLEVRGLGVLNIRAMFGDSAIKLNKFLRLILHLQLPENMELENLDRIRGDTTRRDVLDLSIPQITLPVLPGRNLAVIAEAAVRDFMLKMKGFDAASIFVERHSRMLQGDTE